MNEEILKVKVVVDTSATKRPLQQFKRELRDAGQDTKDMDTRFDSIVRSVSKLRSFKLNNLFTSTGYKEFEASIKNIKNGLKGLTVGSAATATFTNLTDSASDTADTITDLTDDVKDLALAYGAVGKDLAKKIKIPDIRMPAELGDVIDENEYFKEFENSYRALGHNFKKNRRILESELKRSGLKLNWSQIVNTRGLEKEMVKAAEVAKQQGKNVAKAMVEVIVNKDPKYRKMIEGSVGDMSKVVDSVAKEIQKAMLFDNTSIIQSLKNNVSVMDALKSKTLAFKGHMREILKIFNSLPAKIAGAALALGEVLFIVKNIKNALERAQVGDKIKDQSQKALMNYTDYQEWGYVLEQNGIEISALQTAIKTFGATLENSGDSLKQYGITSKSVNEAFTQSVVYIQSLKTETERLTAAQGLYGKRVASELMPVLNSNAGSVQNLMMTYRLLGGTMSNELIGYSDVLADSVLHLKTAFGGLKNTLAQAFMPAIIKVVQWLTILIAKIRMVLAAIFGFKDTFGGKTTGKTGGLLGGTADSADKTAKGLSKATKEAAKLRRYLIGIDELNIMPSKDKSSTPGGSDSGSGTGGIDAGDFAGISDMNGILDDAQLKKLEEFKKKIDGIKDVLRIGTPIFLVAAGALLAVLGFASANIPLGIAGLGLAGMGIALGKANGTWEQLFGGVQKAWNKHKGKITTAIGAVVALLGGITGNIVMLAAGVGIARLGIAVGTKNNEWSKLWNNVKSSIDRYSPYVTAGIGVLAALYGLVIMNPALFITGLGLAGLSIGGISAGGWSNLFNNVITSVKNFKTKIVGALKDIKDSIVDFFSDSWLGEKIKKFKEFFEDFDLSDVMTNMGNWDIFKNIDFDKVKDALSKIAEIAKKIILPDFSGLKNLKDLGGDISAKVKIKFSDTKEKIKDKWKEISAPIKDKTAKFKAKVAAKKEDIKKAWANIKEQIKGKAINIAVKIKAAKDVLKQWWSDVKDKLKIGTIELGIKIGDKWNDIKDDWQKNIVDKAQDAKVKMHAYIATKWNDIKDDWIALKDKMDGHKAKIKVKIPKWSSLSNTWTKLMNKFKGKTVKMKLNIQATVSNLKSWVNTNLIDRINGKLRDTKLFKSIQIPRLAKGGVLTAPTMALMGEYPGANNNPEIVAPQSILKETVISANGELANVFIQMSRQIVNAIENKEMDVRIGDDAIARSAARGNQNFRLATGKNIF